ncbi:hypothetical protein [Bordetella pertussis]|uniref:hypothetical protein n=1 Tax=Bordetella pertussis TaxID=520 RepID=UPI001BFCB230|nr:hypothetical protein [Bordetella pertussis]
MNITRVTHVYERRVVVQHIDRSRVGYHGGPRGIQRRADPREMAAARERHTPPTDMQRDHARQAGRDRAQFDGGARRRCFRAAPGRAPQPDSVPRQAGARQENTRQENVRRNQSTPRQESARASTTRRAPSARGRPNRGATPAALPSGHRAPRRRRAPNRAPGRARRLAAARAWPPGRRGKAERGPGERGNGGGRGRDG